MRPTLASVSRTRCRSSLRRFALRTADCSSWKTPEAHLHPAGQSAIGGFLAQVAADGVQVFIETHSDHVLNGIRVSVAEGTATLREEQTVIYFFRGGNDAGEAVQLMELRRTGQLTDWPSGFFDQTQIDLAALAAHRRRDS